MKKKRKQEAEPDEESAQQEVAGQEPQEEGTTVEATEEPPEELTPEERIAELEGLLQRSRADFANLRRRSLADSDTAVARAETALLREMLTLADWLEMALTAEVTSPDATTLQEGVRLTRDQLTGLLANLGVKEISTTGTFNPDEHQAVSTVDDEDQDPGTIAAVIRKGFLRRSEVLRHAQVKVVAQPEAPDTDKDLQEQATPLDEAAEASNDEPSSKDPA
ncbi:MAG TPA: nucleotide exchange factor GrpE [Planctomycetes bacterium]|nr:nucleotide exchange factor GrpE [Planctomycetota bacterium]HIL37410.1 nucleotide exchange factor GrpE [Planctomycetota bacterium]